MMSDRLQELTGRRPANLEGDEVEDEAEDEDDDEVIQRVLRASVKQQAKDEERRRMAGVGLDPNEVAGITAENEADLSQWLAMAFPSRVQAAVGAAEDPFPDRLAGGSVPSKDSNDGGAEAGIHSGLPFEEQLELVNDLSKRKWRETRDCKVTPRPKHAEWEDEMLRKALALSMDPAEQLNEDMQSVIKAVDVSTRPGDCEGAAATSGVEDVEEEDAELNRILEVSRQDFERAKLQTVGDKRAVDESKKGAGNHEGAAATSRVEEASASAIHNVENDAELIRILEISRQDFERATLQRELDDERAVNESKKAKGARRPIVIDGNNVAFAHGNHQKFSAKAILLCYNYFNDKGHTDITAFCTPGHRMSPEDQVWIQRMSDAGFLKLIVRKKYGQQVIGHYDDYFILRAAQETDGIVVSNDHFRDILGSHPDLEFVIKKRVLPFQFAGDHFIPAEDPLGRNGPKLEAFLKF